MHDTVRKVPWYRVSIVWLVLAIPLTAVLLGIMLLYLSITSYDGLVVDDYYKKGKEIDRVLKRDLAALDHGLVARVSIAGQQLTVQLDSKPAYTPPPTLAVYFFYSTRAGLDKETFVMQQQAGIYRGDIPSLETGRWNVQIEADDWRLIGSLRSPDQQSSVIEPAVTRKP